MNIGIYIYENAEVLDFSGPFEVFFTASRVCNDANPFKLAIEEKNTKGLEKVSYSYCMGMWVVLQNSAGQ